MRRLLPLMLALVAIVAFGAGVAVSSGEDSGAEQPASVKAVAASEPAHSKRGAHRGGKRFGHGMLGVLADQVLGSGAQRLGVEKADLRKAVKETAAAARERHFEAAGLTGADRATLKGCKRAFHRAARRGSCDRAAARAAMRKLRSAGMPDLAKEKELLSTELASKLGKTAEEVLTAARAELAVRLTQAEAMGFVTEKGRDLALGCFDTPGDCNLRALHREVKLPFGHMRGKHRRHP